MQNLKLIFLALLFVANFIFSVHADPLAEWQEWQHEYEATLTGKGGWLSLAGLYWLEEGRNTLGSDPLNAQQFPAHAPRQVGVIQLSGNRIQFDSVIDNLLVDGQKIAHSTLQIMPPTRITFGQFEFYIIQREQQYALRLIDNNSPNAQKFTGVKFMPFNEQAILKGKLIPNEQPRTIDVATVYGSTRKENSAGWVMFDIGGATQKLEAVDYGDDAPLYLYFSDATSGETTYPAGRFLEVARPDEQGNVLIDFNRAYNPPCAYTSYATCPLTPPQNRLHIAIEAGELNNHAPGS